MSTSSSVLLLASASLLASACTSAAPSTNTSTTSGDTPTHTIPTQTPSTPTSTPTSAPTTLPTTDPGKPASLEGNWSSSACGARKYRRNLTLSANGAFTSEDLVSPCPANVACVWSGIVNRDGNWKQDGSSVTLTPSEPNKQAGEPLASPLSWDGSALSEPGSEKTCVYTRK